MTVLSTAVIGSGNQLQYFTALHGTLLDWVKVPSELAQERRAWSASVRGVVNAIGDAGLTRPG